MKEAALKILCLCSGAFVVQKSGTLSRVLGTDTSQSREVLLIS